MSVQLNVALGGKVPQHETIEPHILSPNGVVLRLWTPKSGN